MLFAGEGRAFYYYHTWVMSEMILGRGVKGLFLLLGDFRGGP